MALTSRHSSLFLCLCLSWIGTTMVASTTPCNDNGMAVHLDKLRHLNESNDPPKAMIFADSLLKEFSEIDLKDCEDALWLKYERGESLELNVKFQEALQEYYTIIKVAEQNAYWELAVQSYISIARCHENLGRELDCLRNLDIASNLLNKYGLEKLRGRHAIRLSSYHRLFANKDTARALALKGIEYGHKHNVRRSIVDGHLLLGILSEDLEESIHHFRKTIEYFHQRNNFEAAAIMHQNIVSIYIKNGNYKNAAKELDSIPKFIPLLNDSPKNQFRIKAYFHESKQTIFEHQGLIDSAYHHVKKAHKYYDKIQWQVDQDAVNKNEATFAIEKEKEKTLSLQRATKIQKTWLSIMGIMAFLFSILMIKTFNNKRKIDNQNKIITQRNAELNKALNNQSVLLSEVHHRVKNNLQLVISLLGLKSEHLDLSDKLNYIDLSNKVRSIALIHELIYSGEEFERIKIKNYISSLTDHFQNLKLNEDIVNFTLDIEDIYLNLDTILPLGIICSELLNNSFKYAVAPRQQLEIGITIKIQGNLYELEYKDNGPGYGSVPLSTSKKPIGMKLIQSMVRQLLGTSSTYDQEGAIFKMTFKEKELSEI